MKTEIWTQEQVAAFLHVKPTTVRDKYAYHNNFPKFFRIGDGKNAPKRWLADEVIQWAINAK